MAEFLREVRPKHRAFTAGLAVLFMALLGSACVTNPITGRSQVMMVNDQEAARASRQAYLQLLSAADRAQALDNNPQTLRRVRRITDRLVAQAVQLRPETRGWKWEVHVLKSRRSMPGVWPAEKWRSTPD